MGFPRKPQTRACAGVSQLYGLERSSAALRNLSSSALDTPVDFSMHRLASRRCCLDGLRNQRRRSAAVQMSIGLRAAWDCRCSGCTVSRWPRDLQQPQNLLKQDNMLERISQSRCENPGLRAVWGDAGERPEQRSRTRKRSLWC